MFAEHFMQDQFCFLSLYYNVYFFGSSTGWKAQSCKITIKQEDLGLYKQWEITVLQDTPTFLSWLFRFSFSQPEQQLHLLPLYRWTSIILAGIAVITCIWQWGRATVLEMMMSWGKEKKRTLKSAPPFLMFWWFLCVDKLSVCAKN